MRSRFIERCSLPFTVSTALYRSTSKFSQCRQLYRCDLRQQTRTIDPPRCATVASHYSLYSPNNQLLDLIYVCDIVVLHIYITSAKEVLFSPVSLCLSVCLYVCPSVNITQNLLINFLMKFYGCVGHNSRTNLLHFE